MSAPPRLDLVIDDAGRAPAAIRGNRYKEGSVVLADATPEGGFALTGPADPAVTPSFVRPTLIMDNAAGPRKLPGGAALDLGSRYQVGGALWSGNGMLSDGATG
jgi:hypothetical protein